jgi:hypothetical protein
MIITIKFFFVDRESITTSFKIEDVSEFKEICYELNAGLISQCCVFLNENSVGIDMSRVNLYSINKEEEIANNYPDLSNEQHIDKPTEKETLGFWRSLFS